MAAPVPEPDARASTMAGALAARWAILPAPLALAACLVTLLGLGACGSIQSVSELGFIDQVGWQHRQVTRDVDAIVQGMNRARAQNERLAGRSP